MHSQKRCAELRLLTKTAGSFAPKLSAATDRHEKASLVPESPHPSDLCQQSLNAPVICSACEQFLRFLTQHCTRVSTHVFHIICGKPALDFSQGMTMLFRMLILVSQPCRATFRLVLPIG